MVQVPGGFAQRIAGQDKRHQPECRGKRYFGGLRGCVLRCHVRLRIYGFHDSLTRRTRGKEIDRRTGYLDENVIL